MFAAGKALVVAVVVVVVAAIAFALVVLCSFADDVVEYRSMAMNDATRSINLTYPRSFREI